MRNWDPVPLAFAAVFILLDIAVMRTAGPLAAITTPAGFQMTGSVLVCLWGAWLMRDDPAKQARKSRRPEC